MCRKSVKSDKCTKPPIYTDMNWRTTEGRKSTKILKHRIAKCKFIHIHVKHNIIKDT